MRDQVATYEALRRHRGHHDARRPVVVVTSVGAKSGKLRKNPLMRVEHDGSYALVASQGRRAEPPDLVPQPRGAPDGRAPGRAGPARVHGRASLEGEERAAWWERAVAVWPDYADYQTKTDRQIPVFVLEAA